MFFCLAAWLTAWLVDWYTGGKASLWTQTDAAICLLSAWLVAWLAGGLADRYRS